MDGGGGRREGLAQSVNAQVFLPATKRILKNDHITSETELDRAGRALFGSKWAGIWAADERPKVSKQRPFGIVNEGTRATGGWHWMAVLHSAKGPLVYDSFGRAPSKQAFSQFGYQRLGKAGAEQKKSEDDCGQRSLAALMMASKMPLLVRQL